MSDTNGTALVIRDAQYEETKTGALAMVTTPDEAKERIRMLQDFVKSAMVENTDYGKIPGCGDKPALLQPGAQKLCELYGLAFTFVKEDSVEDWDKPFFFYRRRCVLTRRSDGSFVCDGIGTANSKEKNNWASKPFANVNTIEKFACKRALVMAVLGATRSSGMFTQDIEDNPEAFQRAPVRKTQPRQHHPAAQSDELERQLRASVEIDPFVLEDYRIRIEALTNEDDAKALKREVLTRLPESPERSKLGDLWVKKFNSIRSLAAVGE